MKFVPESDLSCLAGPLMVKKRVKALMQLEASIEAITSIWTVLDLIQQNNMAYRLLSDCTPLVRLVVMCHCLKKSSPAYVKGGQRACVLCNNSHSCEELC